jgi:mono/diheme cytochrome c family protein
MRTNYSGFALAVSMGLIVLLLGFLALSAGGLVQLGPVGEVAALPADSLGGVADDSLRVMPTAYQPANPEEAAAITAGDALFKANCAQCHAVKEKVVGPALAGITKRRPISWIIPWVRNSAKVIASGDDYAVKVFNDNGKQQMPAFPQLADKDVKNIVAWVESQQGASMSVSGAAVAAR